MRKADQKDHDTMMKQGIVTKIFNKQVEVMIDDETIPCAIPKTYMTSKNSIGVGDSVEVFVQGPKNIKIMRQSDRKTAVYRGNRKALGEEILIAANVDQMVVVVTAEYLINQTGYIEEAVIAAERAKIKVSLYISKWDMVNEQVHHLVQEKVELYKKLTEHVFINECEETDTDLIKYLNNKITVFVGDRGCGKSTVIHKICDGTKQRERKEKLPSTNAVEMISCENMRFIDTPGFRDFTLQKITQEELSVVFHEITEQEQFCKYHNCTHTHEDGCSVLDSIQRKLIRRERYLAYQRMRGVVPENKDRRIEKADYRHNACTESFVCKSCGKLIVPEGAGTQHRNHCPYCLCSLHVDHEPGDRASLCHGIMKPIGVWVRNDGEWAIIHRCSTCGALSSNRIAADDSPIVLMSIAVKPLSRPPFPLDQLETKL